VDRTGARLTALPSTRHLPIVIRVLVGAALSVSTAGPVIPWVNERPPSVPEPPLAKPCQADGLRTSLFLQGATGSLVGGVTVRNATATKCSLRGRVHVHFVGASAEATRWETVAGPALARDPSAVYDRGSSLRALGPGRPAYVPLQWRNWCPPGTAETSVGAPPEILIVDLPRRRGSLHLPLSGAPRCDSPPDPSVLVVGRLTRRGRYLPQSSRLPLRASIAAPLVGDRPKKLPTLRVRRGDTLSYTATLTNASRRPYRFGRCPFYMETLAPGGPVASFVLNCRLVGTLRPGDTARFAMQIRVPRATPIGAHGLSWVLAPTTYLPSFAAVRVLVSR
jgi:hypothetical protein